MKSCRWLWDASVSSHQGQRNFNNELVGSRLVEANSGSPVCARHVLPYGAICLEGDEMGGHLHVRNAGKLDTSLQKWHHSGISEPEVLCITVTA